MLRVAAENLSTKGCDRANVMQLYAAEMCEMRRFCFPIVLWLRWLGKSAPKNGRVRRIGCPRCRQNLRHAVARERFGSQNR